MRESIIFLRRFILSQLLVSAELTVQPVGEPVVIVVQYRGPQEVGDELRKRRSLDVLDFRVHVTHVGSILLHEALSGDVKQVRGVHLVAPVSLLPKLELVPVSGDKPIERMTDECETEG